jgi:hypothetical protein
MANEGLGSKGGVAYRITVQKLQIPTAQTPRKNQFSSFKDQKPAAHASGLRLVQLILDPSLCG